MKNLITFFFLTLIVLLTTCGSKSTDLTANGDENAQVSEEQMMPAFIYYLDDKNMHMLYWTTLEKNEDSDESWEIQNTIRKNAKNYDKLYIRHDSIIEVKYVGETLKDPDGNDAAQGLRNQYYPMMGLDYEATHPVQRTDDEFIYDYYLLVNDHYLSTHQPLPVKKNSWSGTESDIPLSAGILSQLEKEHGMKTQRSHIIGIIGDKYTYGIVQFKPKDGKVVALEILNDGKKTYSIKKESNYDPSEPYSIWNVDDDGVYMAGDVAGAFEGPKGLELYFTRRAPESLTTGVMTIKDGKLDCKEIAGYYCYPENPKPIWRKDITLKSRVRKNANGQVAEIIIDAVKPDGSSQELKCKLPWAKDESMLGNAGTIREEDINFDGIKDLIVYLGSYGFDTAKEVYDAFFWNEGSTEYTDEIFTHVNGFTEMGTPTVDAKERCIIGRTTDSDGATLCKRYEIDYVNNGFKLVKTWKE